MQDKISIPREGQARIPRGITADDALRLVRDAGFERIRSGHHWIVRRDDVQLTLPTTGTLSPWLTQLVHRAAAVTGEPAALRNGDRIPLTVLWKDQPYAVESRVGSFYKLIDLDDGHTALVPVVNCKPVVLEAPKAVPAVREEPAMEEPVVVTAPQYTPPPMSDRDTWIRMTTRFIESLNVRFEQLRGELDSVRTQRDAMQAMLDMFTGTSPVTPSTAPKRTVLPPAGKGKNNSYPRTRKARYTFTDADKEVMKAEYETGSGTSTIARNHGWNPSTVIRALRAYGVEIRPWGSKF